MDNHLASLDTALIAASIACLLRPTSVVIWLCMGLQLLVSSSNWSRIIIKATRIGIFAVLGMLLLDRIYYREWVFTPWNFFHYNVTMSISEFYGSHPWHWYLTQGIFVVLGTFSVPFLPSLIQAFHSGHASLQLARLIIFTTLAYSLLAHKEFRFIYPLVPPSLVLGSTSLAKWNSKRMAFFLMATNVPFALYLGLVHERGPLRVVEFLRTQPNLQGALFLMPCHSTPWQSHIHQPNAKLEFLTCEPPTSIPTNQRSHYLDEADVFYNDPTLFIWSRFSKQFGNKTLKMADLPGTSHVGLQVTTNRMHSQLRPWPSHIVFFDGDERVSKLIRSMSMGSNFHECRRFGNTAWHQDPRRRGDLVIYCQN
jgi:phosphatidylinositol glycan class B